MTEITKRAISMCFQKHPAQSLILSRSSLQYKLIGALVTWFLSNEGQTFSREQTGIISEVEKSTEDDLRTALEPLLATDHHEHLAAKGVAESAAAYAHQARFNSRRGLLPSDNHLLVVYDNEPRNGTTPRAEVLNNLKVGMAARGATLIAEANYPLDGQGQGHTVSLVWTGPTGVIDKAIGQLWRDLLDQ